MFLINLLLSVLVSAIAISYFRYRQHCKVVKAGCIDLAHQLTANEMLALQAYEHYYDCGQPEKVRLSLLEKGLIMQVSTHKYAITWIGKFVGEYLALFAQPMHVIAGDSMADSFKTLKANK